MFVKISRNFHDKKKVFGEDSHVGLNSIFPELLSDILFLPKYLWISLSLILELDLFFSMPRDHYVCSLSTVRSVLLSLVLIGRFSF